MIAHNDADDVVGIRFGESAFYRAGIALFLLGFASFSLIYCVQPLLPIFVESFQISPASSALSLSITTFFLAFSIVLSSAFSQSLGRKGLMLCSMGCAAVLNLVCAWSPSWHALVLMRAVEGFVLGGVPAVAMAWIAEEIHPGHLAKAMGLYIAGTAFGGMMGRVSVGIMAEYFSWRYALSILAIMSLLCCIGFYYLLPASKNFVAQKGINLQLHLHAWWTHLCNKRMLLIYSLGFLSTSIFVCLFNYLTFYLGEAPFSLSYTQISLIFLVYSFGILSSSMSGYMADRLGRFQVLYLGLGLIILGILMTLIHQLWCIIIGIGLFTTGFFFVHAMASSQVGLLAKHYKGHATSIYLLFYYVGSSIVGTVGGWFWQAQGWTSIVGLTLSLCLCAVLVVFAAQKLSMKTYQ